MLIYPEAFTRFLSSVLCLSFISVLELIINLDHSLCLKVGDSWVILSTEGKWTKLNPLAQR